MDSRYESCGIFRRTRKSSRFSCGLAALALTLFVATCTKVDAPPAFEQVRIGDKHFTLELALDGEARYQGLSDRAAIPDEGGMLFVFSNAARVAFVMRRCLVPIDLLFLDAGRRVIAMHQMQVEPYDTSEKKLKRYGSQWPAQFAIELKGGTIDLLGIHVGQSIDLPVDELKARAR